jgi:hypothetical protein
MNVCIAPPPKAMLLDEIPPAVICFPYLLEQNLMELLFPISWIIFIALCKNKILFSQIHFSGFVIIKLH